jgi:hypothetical protein
VSAGQPHASTSRQWHRSPQTSCQLPVVLIARQPSYGQPPNLRHEPLRVPGRSHDVIVARSGRDRHLRCAKDPRFPGIEIPVPQSDDANQAPDP